MKDKKGLWAVIITAFAIIANLLGRVIASNLDLPVWLDSFGTLLIAYAFGPVCGGIVGLVNNIIYGIFVDQQFIYCIVGMLIGVIAGVLANKKTFESRFKVMTLGVVLSLICTAMSVPLNILFFNCEIGNVWGDQIILMCVNNGIPKILACILAQFYIEFLDKLICVYGVYLIIRFVRKMRKKDEIVVQMFLCVLVGACLIATPVQAAEKTSNVSEEDYNAYTHTIYSSDEGLLAGEANDIAQTKEGQIWIGTYAGVYGYDGTQFKLYNDIDSIKNVNDLYVDEEGRLWVGTNDNGVTMMINGHVMNVIDVQDGLLSNSVKSIVCDSNGLYYIGNSDGISIVTLNGGVKIEKNFKEIKNTAHLCADNNGRVIAVTDNNEIFCFQDGELVKSKIAGIEGKVIRSAYFSREGKLYIGTGDNKVYVYQDGSGKQKEGEIACSGLSDINTFFETEDNEIFVCADNGVGYFDEAGRFKTINTDRFTSSIDNMMIDYQGNLWFASARQGLLKLCKSSFTGLFEQVSEVSHVVNAAVRVEDMLLCGTDDGLIIIDEGAKKTITNELTKLFKQIRIRQIYVDSDDYMWISTTGNGLYKIKKVKEKYEIKVFDEKNGMPGNRFRCCVELENGEIVCVGDGGIAFIANDKVKKIITEEDLVNVKSLCVLEYNGKIYVGSDGGGITVINNYEVERRITKVNGLSSDVIMRLVYDEKSQGIFAVTSNGLCYISKDGEVKNIDKFPYSNNFDIIPGKNENMWVLSSAGIYVVNSAQLVENEKIDYDLLNSKRGLRASLTANSYSYNEDGELYLCCDSDLVKVDTNEYNYSAKSYRMILNSVKVDGHEYEISRTQALSIKAAENMIIFQPKILNYSLNDPYISYQLQGGDEKEKVILLSELKDITYSNLKPGKYTFKISVLDNSKKNVIETGSYVLYKENEMYENWWFRLYVFCIAAMVVVWATWYITKSKVQKTVLKQKLELEYAKKQIEMGNETILSIARTVDAKDSNTSEHSFRVSQYSVAIARRFGFSEKQCENIRQMALLHDIGKIGIPDSILNKPARLTDEEYEIMKSHVVRGGEILKDFTLIENVNVGALYHHERYDGKGYCSGLKGEEIPVEARIIGIADAFDAMTANRVYRKQLDIEVVIAELKRCRGTQFDPNFTDIMLTLIDEGVIDVETLYKKSKEAR